MPNDDHEDRQAILSRRAALISAALVGLACTTSGGDPALERELRELLPGSELDGQSELTKPSWEELMTRRPALSIPEGLSVQERDDLGRLAELYMAKYEQLRHVWELDASCSPLSSDCEVWSEVAALVQAEADTPNWGYFSSTTSSVDARDDAHQRYVRAIRERLLRHLDEQASDSGFIAHRVWRSRIRSAQRRTGFPPCLSIAAPPPLSSASACVPFEVDEASFSPDSDQLRQLFAELSLDLGEGPRTIFVRGHADARERAPLELARERAEAVRAWLIREGIPARELQLRVLGAGLPILPYASEVNRRVDFELVLDGSPEP